MKNKTFQTEADYLEARRKHDLNHAATLDYCKQHKTNGIPTEITSTFPFADEVNNDLRTKIEVWEFINEKPGKYFLYINEKDKTATTWTGAELGKVIFGTEYRSNMNDKRQSVTVTAINGCKYHGIYFKSSGDYARVTKSKSK